MASMQMCRARLLSDLSAQTVCDKEATSVDGRLCAFHSRQCQGLYRGYKRRNAELDALAQSPPEYLAKTKVSLVVQDFQDVDDEAVLRELHSHLFRKYTLIDRVVRARKLHHSHFYAVDMDYGHEKYLTKLQNDRHVAARALERLGRRRAEIQHAEEQWIDWVKESQQGDEEQRDSESRKVKLEAMLFKRHQKEMEKRQHDKKAQEDRLRQEQALEDAYHQRLSEMSEEEQDSWDPVQDVYGYERDNYVDLVKFFLMLQDQDAPENSKEESSSEATSGPTDRSGNAEKTLSKSAKKRMKKANAEMKKLSEPSKGDPDGRSSGTIEMETRAQMRQRLSDPVEFERQQGWYTQAEAKWRPLTDDELDPLLNEIAEVKNFLFCRILLSHASLFPIALRSNSIEEFLENEEVTRESLRDVCLKLERPRLQDLRDACADYIRGENEDEEDEDEEGAREDEQDTKRNARKQDKHHLTLRDGPKRIPDKYRTKREKALDKQHLGPKEIFGDEESGMLDFGKTTNESDYRQKKMRIRVCGRTMYNYPSEKALNRGGWFHFSVIAKDSDLSEAVELCRNWREFYELNILCVHQFFPAPKWTKFIGDATRQQLMWLGFIPYFISDKAEMVTHHVQSGSRGMARRSHEIVEVRNLICGHIKRDDPISRRFIQYLSMETWEIRALVRDCKTGRVLIKPPDEELWLSREKIGWGRATRNDFKVLKEVGPVLFEEMDKRRKWHFSFKEYYDILVWDARPGRSFFVLQRKLEEVLARALRVRNLNDLFNIAAPILKQVTKDPKTERVRSIKPGENATSIWESIQGGSARAVQWSPRTGETREGLDDTYMYTEADELEDAMLFPLEATGNMTDNLFKEAPSALDMFEMKPVLDIRRFANDMDSDEELSEDLDDIDTDDGDEEWDTEDSGSAGEYEYFAEEEGVPEAKAGEAEKAIEVLSEQFEAMTFSGTREPDYFLSVLKNPTAAKRIPKSIRDSPPDLMCSLRFSLIRQRDYSNTSNDALHADFLRHIDREKSKLFKQGWHMADMSPGALTNYYQWTLMIMKMDNFVMSRLTSGPFELCKLMKMAPLFTEEHRIVKDAFEAYAAIALFFDTEDFLASNHGKLFQNSALFDQAERAKHPPDRRTHRSNKTMSKSFWKDWEELVKSNNRDGHDNLDDIYPLEWRKAIRPVVIRLFRAGIICRHYTGTTSGKAIAAAEPNRPLDLYIDYRESIPLAQITSHLTDPTDFDRAYILKRVRRHAKQFPTARFSVLRMWSAPHFYPLMLGMEKREYCSFNDDRGRAWAFRFIPKDMPYSEWSAQQQLSLRLQPYKDVFGDLVFVARDLIVVMGRDQRDVRRLSEGVTWAVQTKPWRLEIDFWRSFVNVDATFLEELDERWLE